MYLYTVGLACPGHTAESVPPWTYRPHCSLLDFPACLLGCCVEASFDAFLLLIVDIALQNELDNIRAQLSQKGKLLGDWGPWEVPDLGAGGRGLGRKASSLLVELGPLPVLYSKSFARSCDWQERRGKGGA